MQCPRCARRVVEITTRGVELYTMRSCTSCTYRAWTIDQRDASIDEVVRSVGRAKRNVGAWVEASR